MARLLPPPSGFCSGLTVPTGACGFRNSAARSVPYSPKRPVQRATPRPDRVGGDEGLFARAFMLMPIAGCVKYRRPRPWEYLRVCFSMTADVVAGAALVPVAVRSLREVKHRSELLFALLPAIFALHQFLEVAVWAGLDGDVPAGVANFAMRGYLFIAWPLLPIYVPLALLMLENQRAGRRVLPFVALGAVVSVYLSYVVLANPVAVIQHSHGLEYDTAVRHPLVWAVLYIVAVIGPALVSGYHSIVAFGVLNLVGLIVVAVFYFESFASLWCVFASASSILILVHMIRRRQVPDALRAHADPVRISLIRTGSG